MPSLFRNAEVIGIWLALAGVVCIFIGFRLPEGSKRFAVGVTGIWLASIGTALAFVLITAIAR